MANKERPCVKKIAQELVAEIQKTGQWPTIHEVTVVKKIRPSTATKVLIRAKGITHKEKMEKIIQEALTGEIPGITPICSVHDKPEERQLEEN